MSNFGFISIKSQIGVEIRRYTLFREDCESFGNFYKKIELYHHLKEIPFVIFYRDSEDFLLPINNKENLAKAINSSKHIILHNVICNNNRPVSIRRRFLKIFIEKKGIFLDYYNGNLPSKCKKSQHFKGFSNLIMAPNDQGIKPSISMPEDFRQVSSIIDADILPATRRRVVLKRGGSDKPLGFYIRDGTYYRMNPQGNIEKNYGVFISRLVPGGLAESTNLLAENDEILEVNGIEVGKNKSLDQVRDMMVANSSNLIITTRPAKHNTNYNKMCNRSNFNGRGRLPSTQSNGELMEDSIKHYMS